MNDALLITKPLFVLKKKPLAFIVCALISGCLFLFAYLPFGRFLLAWCGLLPLLYFANRNRPFLFGYLWGIAFFGLGLCWIIPVAGLLAWFFLAAYLSLYPALFGLLLFRIRTRFWLLWAASLGVLLEFIAANLLSGFPWFILAASQAPFPPALALSSLLGPHFLSFLIILTNLSLFSLFWRPEKKESLCVLVVVGILLLLGGQQTHQYAETRMGKELRFAAVQANIPSALRQQGPTLEPYLNLSAILTEKVDLLIWPETVFIAEGGHLPNSVQALLREKGCYLLTGVLEGQPEGWYNSAILYDPAGRALTTYRKRHLVPFGEFTPGKRWRLVRFLVQRQAGFLPDIQRGRETAPMEVAGFPLSVFICYEDIFAEEVLSGSFLNSAFIILSNDSWLSLLGSYQHFAFASLRAAENQTEVVRVANTGVTAHILPSGLVAQKIPCRKSGILVGTIKRGANQTLYRSLPFLFPFMALVLVTLLLSTGRSNGDKP